MSLRTFAVSLAVAALAGSTAAAPATSAVPVPVLAWHDCENGYQCATATVPMDYRHPHGATVELAVMRAPAVDSAHRVGSLFLLPGGPGESGLDVLSAQPPQTRALLSGYDFVSFDPRGLGASRPQVSCGPTVSRDVILTRPRDTDPQRAEALLREFGAACQKYTGPILAHLSAANTARDLDLLRAAVGDSKLTAIGTGAVGGRTALDRSSPPALP